MTKNEFIRRLTEARRRQNVADADDVIAEYQQHFAFKLADGYSEEEIAARLGDPAALAAQFAQSGAPEKKSARKPLLAAGLGLADLFAGMFFLLLIAWGVTKVNTGWPFGIAAVLCVGGINLLALGVCGVYFERMYDELKGRPLYIVRQVLRTEQPKELDR